VGRVKDQILSRLKGIIGNTTIMNSNSHSEQLSSRINKIINPSTFLASTYIEFKSQYRILIARDEQGILATYIASQLEHGQIDLFDYDLIQLRHAEKTIQNSQISNVNVLFDPFFKDYKKAFYNLVIIYQPKGRSLTRKMLLEALFTLKEGGSLYVTGSNKSGIRSTVRDAHQLFGNSKILGYKKGNIIVKFNKLGKSIELPDWASLPGIALGTWYKFDQEWDGQKYRFFTLPGVFSFRHLDDGTRFLLKSLPEVTNQKILDIGCGYGVIGVITYKKGARFVCFVDNNLLAIECTKKNMQQIDQNNYRVIASNVLSDINEYDFDLAISNPPFHRNLETNYSIARDIIHQSRQHLRDGGQLIIVANLFLKYDEILREQFNSVERINQNNKFHVLLATK